MTKALVAAPFIPISRFPHSHRGAQGVIYADLLKQAGKDVTLNASLDLYHDDFNQFDELYVYHGNDFDGHLNIYGGLQNFPYAHNTRNFSFFRGRVFSLAIDFPDYHSLLSHKRHLTESKGKPMQQEWRDLDWDNLKSMQERSETVTVPFKSRKVVIGDSHAIALYRPGWTMDSRPYRTLFGTLKKGLMNLVPDWSEFDEVDLYYGNIDVRHHLCRRPVPREAALELAGEYVRQAAYLQEQTGVKVRLYPVMPIENERRPVPKTGWYEGTPFFGSWQERDDVRQVFNSVLAGDAALKGVEVDAKFWDYLKNDLGELDFRHMERPKSVHLSRASYPYWQGHEWTGSSLAQTLSA